MSQFVLLSSILNWVWLVYNCFLFIMFIYSDYSSSEYTKIHFKLKIKMNEPIFNSVHHLNRPYTIAIRQWLPRGVSNCMVFNFKRRNNGYIPTVFCRCVYYKWLWRQQVGRTKLCSPKNRENYWYSYWYWAGNIPGSHRTFNLCRFDKFPRWLIPATTESKTPFLWDLWNTIRGSARIETSQHDPFRRETVHVWCVRQSF